MKTVGIIGAAVFLGFSGQAYAFETRSSAIAETAFAKSSQSAQPQAEVGRDPNQSALPQSGDSASAGANPSGGETPVPAARQIQAPGQRFQPAGPVAFRPARVMNLPGLEGVIGADASRLQHIFGLARLDVWEGDARKLQWVGPACVLDVYLYPPQQGAEPTATYLDARRASDSLDVDRAACVKALKKR